MLLLARSALCIGLVVAALPDAPTVPRPRAASAPMASERVAAEAGRLCARDPGACLRAVGALAPLAGPPRAGTRG